MNEANFGNESGSDEIQIGFNGSGGEKIEKRSVADLLRHLRNLKETEEKE